MLDGFFENMQISTQQKARMLLTFIIISYSWNIRDDLKRRSVFFPQTREVININFQAQFGKRY